VVFVGYSDLHDPGQPDRFYSVFTTDDGVDLSGVEIMATAFSNILAGDWLKPSEVMLTVATFAAYGFAAGFLATMLPALLAVPVVAGFGLAYVVAAEWAFESRYLWLPLATPVLVQLPIALLCGITMQYLVKRRKERRVTAAISHYLPEKALRDLIRTDFNPDSINRLVYGTILASDMSGFTTISEHKSPEELAIFMNTYFDAMGSILKKHGIDFIEFHADTIMCAWTGNVGEVKLEPLHAAVELVEAIIAFGAHQGVPLKARVGIKEGEFYLGHTGGGGRVSFSILGDTANAAARLETLNKHLGTRILASETAVGSGKDFVMRPLGRFRVVGRGEAIPVVEVLGSRTTCGAETIDLCDRFAHAMIVFGNEDWMAATWAFQSILDRWPGDGPSQFYLRCCGDYLQHAPTVDPGIVRMVEK
jgi:adenylate cyclase